MLLPLALTPTRLDPNRSRWRSVDLVPILTTEMPTLLAVVVPAAAVETVQAARVVEASSVTDVAVSLPVGAEATLAPRVVTSPRPLKPPMAYMRTSYK